MTATRRMMMNEYDWELTDRTENDRCLSHIALCDCIWEAWSKYWLFPRVFIKEIFIRRDYLSSVASVCKHEPFVFVQSKKWYWITALVTAVVAFNQAFFFFMWVSPQTSTCTYATAPLLHIMPKPREPIICICSIVVYLPHRLYKLAHLFIFLPAHY